MNKKVELKSTISVILFVFLVLLFVFAYKPLSNEIEDLKSDLTSKELELASLNSQLLAYQEDEADYMQYSDVSLTLLESMLPEGVSQDEVISDLSDLALAHDLSLNSMSFSQGGEVIEGVNVLKLNTSFNGDYRDLIRFLEGLEQNERKISINSISVQVSDSNVGDTKRANFSLSLDAYYLP